MIPFAVRRRVNYLYYGCLFIMFLIVLKLAHVQLFGREALLNRAVDLWQRDFIVSGQRGSIMDRNGEVLALDLPSTSIMVVPAQIDDPVIAAQQLSQILDADYDVIYNKLVKKVSTQKLQPEGRQISNEAATAIQQLNLSGVYLVPDSLRYYPKGAYLAQVLGFTGIDNQGLAGLEMQYDELLSAKSGSLKIAFDAKGHPLTSYAESYEASGTGIDIVLTIDANIQNVLEREMNNLMARYEPESAWAVAVNPNTGEILAMVSKPDYDPNHYQDYDPEIYNRNLPVWKSYEPGSTFKTVTFSAGLEEKLFDMLKDTYFDRGYELVEGARLKSWKRGGHGLQTYVQLLQNSSNPGFVHIAQLLGGERLLSYIKAYGFGSKTNVDLPGEAAGILFDEANWGLLEQSTTGFGQGISVTALQLTMAFCATVNGGTLYQPYITKALLHPTTKDVLLEVKPNAIRQVISEDTSFQMRYALETVVASGGAKQAYLYGWRIGGKTGTAQKAVNGAYLSGEYILSFISAAPIDNPQIVLYIAADAPKSDIQYGGTVVAPVAKQFYEDVLAQLDVPKTSEQMSRVKLWGDATYVTVEDYIGKSKKEVKSSQVQFVFAGEGDKVIRQLPASGTKIIENGTVWLYLANGTVEGLVTGD